VIWDSVFLMSCIDISLILTALCTMVILYRHYDAIQLFQLTRSITLIMFGLGIIAVFHLFDLFTMLYFPIVTSPQAATIAMTDLYLNWSWVNTLISVGSIAMGLLLMLRKLIPEAASKKAANVLLQQEIAERKQVGVKLRESEGWLRTLLEAAEDVAFLMETDGTIIIHNEQLMTSLSIDVDNLVGMSIYDLLPNDVAEIRREQTNQAITSGQPVRFEDERQGRFFDNLVQPILDNQGQVESLGVFARDITERKQAEQSLHKSEKRLAEAQRIAHIGSWDWDIVNNELIWSDEIYRIFGTTPQDFEATYEAFLEMAHPADRAIIQKAVDQALYENKPYSTDHRIVLPGGEERIVHEQAEVIFDEVGKPIRMVGTVQDITKRRQSEDEEVMFGKILENSLNEIYIFDNEDLHFIWVNRGAQQNLGYSIRELKNLTPIDLKPEFTVPGFQELIQPLRTGEVDKIQGSICVSRRS
jgi:PAS domain S-box-containing protein